MNIKAKILIAACVLLSACEVRVITDGEQEESAHQRIEVVELPETIQSFGEAQELGSEVVTEVVAIFNSDPQKYDPKKVGIRVNWGETQNMLSGDSIYYIRVIGSSIGPIEEEPELLELVDIATELVHEKIELRGG